MSKPFKESKLGSWLKTNAPKALDIVGDVLPDKGVLGILKNIISSDPEIPAEQRLEFEKLIADHEQEMAKLEVQDRDSARHRETEFVKATGHIDRFMFVLGIYILLAFGFCMYVTVYVKLPETAREMFIEIRATTRDMLLGIGTYYWGSSAGSRIKDMKPK
jgi:hypothetical protein